MKYSQYLGLLLIAICTLLLSLALEDAGIASAKTLLASPISPIKDRDGDSDGPPPASEKGEFEPGQGGDNTPVKDPETPSFSVIFTAGAVNEPVKIKFFSTGFPQNMTSLLHTISVPDTIVPTSMNSPYFFFGVWKKIGVGGTINQFEQPILIRAPYHDSGLTASQETSLRIWMYNPVIQSWIKLGGSVDIFNNVITGITVYTSPIEANGNTLFALALDSSPEPVQQLDSAGNTTLSLPGRNDFRFQVPPGVVQVGAHFEITELKQFANSDPFRFLSPPVNIAIYFIDHLSNSPADNRQITELAEPIIIEFDLGPDALAGAGSNSSFTIVTLKDNRWVDVTRLGYELIIENDKVIVQTTTPGIFGLAAIR